MENSNTHLMLTAFKTKEIITVILGALTAVIIFNTII